MIPWLALSVELDAAAAEAFSEGLLKACAHSVAIDAPAVYDLVVCNILFQSLTVLAPLLGARTLLDGWLLFAGGRR